MLFSTVLKQFKIQTSIEGQKFSKPNLIYSTVHYLIRICTYQNVYIFYLSYWSCKSTLKSWPTATIIYSLTESAKNYGHNILQCLVCSFHKIYEKQWKFKWKSKIDIIQSILLDHAMRTTFILSGFQHGAYCTYVSLYKKLWTNYVQTSFQLVKFVDYNYTMYSANNFLQIVLSDCLYNYKIAAL